MYDKQDEYKYEYKYDKYEEHKYESKGWRRKKSEILFWRNVPL